MEYTTNKWHKIDELQNYEKLNKYNFANLLSVVINGEKSYFNACKTINFKNIDDISPQYFTLYEVKSGDTWTNISYRFYNTIALWWLLCKFNNIVNPFTELTSGMLLKIPSDVIVTSILEMLKNE